MDTNVIIGLVGLAVFLIFIFIGFPVAAAMIICGVAGCMFFLRTPAAAINFFSSSVISQFTSYTACVAPMFIMMGELASESGIGPNMIDALQKIMGRVRGGLAVVVQVVSALFGAINGSGAATIGLMCRIAYPQMRKHGYSDPLSAGCIAAGSCLSTLIPPSVLLISYGICVSESIAKLFVGGIMTGIVLMLLFIVVIQIWTLVKKDAAPHSEKTSMKEKVKAFREGSFIELLIVFGIAMGGMFGGIFTATEAGGVGFFGLIIVSIITRRFSFKMLVRAAENTVVMVGMMYLLLAAATVFAKFFTLSQMPAFIGNLVTNLDMAPVLVILVITIIYLVLGCFIDALPLMLLTAPILLPVVQAIGYNGIWFGCYVVVIMGLASITPPVGIACYLTSGFGNVPLTTVFRGALPFCGAYIACGLLMAVFPQIATWLPNIING